MKVLLETWIRQAVPCAALAQPFPNSSCIWWPCNQSVDFIILSFNEYILFHWLIFCFLIVGASSISPELLLASNKKQNANS